MEETQHCFREACQGVVLYRAQPAKKGAALVHFCKAHYEETPDDVFSRARFTEALFNGEWVKIKSRGQHPKPAAPPPDEPEDKPLMLVPAPQENQGDTALVPAPPPPQALAQRFAGASMTPITEAEQERLTAAPEDEEVEIRPDGIVYLPWNFYAGRLDQVFGAGHWSRVPLGEPRIVDNVVIWGFDLYVRGHYISTSYGQCQYNAKNRGLNYGDTIEGAKSDALGRLCKELRIAAEVYDIGWRLEWTERMAVRVWGRQNAYARADWLWRRKDRPPFFWEGHPDRSAESPYHGKPDYVDEARSHMDAIKEGR